MFTRYVWETYVGSKGPAGGGFCVLQEPGCEPDFYFATIFDAAHV